MQTCVTCVKVVTLSFSLVLAEGAIRKQLAAFLEGFYEIIPKRLISIFTEQELELLISGLPNIDIDDLKANTEYHKYQSSSIQVGPYTGFKIIQLVEFSNAITNYSARGK